MSSIDGHPRDVFQEDMAISITQDLTEDELLRMAIASMGGDLPRLGDGAGDKALFMPALANAVGDKFFLVFDDMCR